MLVFAVGFNLWLYRLEPTTLSDPNDNTFQFALVDRTNQMWDFAAKECAKTPFTYPLCFIGYMVDHWVPNWAQGYNLPYYYSHIPQIAIVASYKLFTPILGALTLFTYYHWIIYLLLCVFPLSVFLGLKIIRTSWLTAGIGALLASQLSTDGLYGLDPPSFLWRGYGLSSQLFAMVWMPLAIAYAYRFLTLPGLLQYRWQTAAYTEWLAITRPFALVIQTIRNRLAPGRKRFNLPDEPEHAPELRRLFWLAAGFGILTTAGHLGIGIMTIFSLGFLGISPIIMAIMEKQPIKEIFGILMKQSVRILLLAGSVVFFLSYWIIPTQLHGNYHNISVWDPVWKFDSYGWNEILNMFFNGELFDFGRAPIMTGMVLIGAFACFLITKIQDDSTEHHVATTNQQPAISNQQTIVPFMPFTFLLVFWMLFFFGRATWGGLIDMIPGMKDVHLSRFIVGVHMAGLFLAPIGFIWIIEHISLIIVRLLAYAAKLPALRTNTGLGLMVLWISTAAGVAWLFPSVYIQTVRYNDLNNKLIVQANGNFEKDKPYMDELFATLRGLPGGRIYAGRAGWGSKFEIAETPYNMMLSTYGLSTVMWLPETWSMNSDTEQFFSEDVENNYDLYNIRYVVTPPNIEPKPFWTPVKETAKWKLYEVQSTTGYITTGTNSMVVSLGKETYINIVHLWIQSPQHVDKLYPEFTFQKKISSQLPVIRMLDEVTYQTTDGQQKNIFADPPLVTGVTTKIAETEEKNIADMIFSSTVTVTDPCVNCIVILRHTDHPNWQVKLNGKRVERFTVFPFFVAARLPGPGTYNVEFSYKPSLLKMTLLSAAGIAGLLFSWGIILSRRKSL